MGEKEFSLEVNNSEYLPVKDVNLYLTDASHSAVGVQLGQLCFGDYY